MRCGITQDTGIGHPIRTNITHFRCAPCRGCGSTACALTTFVSDPLAIAAYSLGNGMRISPAPLQLFRTWKDFAKQQPVAQFIN